ncbi:hypothetical protein FRB94_001817 [Tulasnella sp. JGI-2019a]|nr:hypothetical protein FRB94_001817 [Tulasnella sp. JGI-2019a]
MEPALDDIWREVHLDGLKPLLPLFPIDALSGQSVKSELTLTRVLEPHEWARFDNITRRIRSIISCDLSELSDSLADFLHRSLQLRGEHCLLSGTINTIHRLRLNLNSAIQLTLLPLLLNPHLKEVELVGWCGTEVCKLPDYAESNMNSAISAISEHHFVELENLSITFGTIHKQPSWTMDTTALLDVLRQNPSLKTVTLRLPIPGVAVLEELSHLPRLERLQIRFPFPFPSYDISDPPVVEPTNANGERKPYNIDVTASNSLFTAEQNPDGTTLTSVVQLLVHGIGFDSSYFGGPGTPSNDSDVEWAAAASYNTFRYDKLGIGFNEHPEDVYNIAQAPTNAAIVMEIIPMISTGDIGGFSGIKVTCVGRSYGSAQLNYITSVASQLLAGVILTGFTFNA